MKLSTRSAVACSAVVALGLVAAPAAVALDGSQTATGTATDDLSLSVPATVAAVAELKAGQEATFSPTAIAVVTPNGATSAWTLQVKDSTNGGKLAKTSDLACITASDALIDDQLDYTSTALLGTGQTSELEVGSTVSSVATGNSLADTVTVDYSLDVPSSAQLAALCPYTTSLTYTLTG